MRSVQRRSWRDKMGSGPVLTRATMFIVEFRTRSGKVSERYETLEEAKRRVESFPAEALVGLPLVFEELPDASERAVREDGKPLQFHRVLAEDMPMEDEDPIPLAEGESGLLHPDGQLGIVDPRHEGEG